MDRKSVGYLIAAPLRLLLSGAVFAASAWALAPPPAAQAAVTFAVTKTADTADAVCDADCSLREAIIAANATAGADTITLPAGTYTLTIPGRGENAAATGDLDVTDGLTINGAGATSTIVDGGALDRVFDVRATLPVTISGVTIRNGSAQLVPNVEAGEGGGVRGSFAGSLTLTDCIVTLNTATGLGAGGGGISTGPLTLTGTTVTMNSTSGQGAGVGAAAAISITNSAITNNTSTANQGGGLFALNPNMTMTGTTITGNTAEDDGGGIYINGTPPRENNPAQVTITDSTIDGNTISRGSGGGMFILSLANVSISRTSMSGNTVNGGGGGGGILNGATLTIVDSMIGENTLGPGDGNGGGIENRGPLTITDSTISGNAAGPNGGNGGGIENDAPLTIVSSTISGNAAGEGGDGGGIRNSEALTISNSTISGNTSTGGGAGGGLFNSGGTASISSTTIVNNSVSGSTSEEEDVSPSGGIRNLDIVSLRNTIVANNTGGNCDGTITDGGANLQFPDTSCGAGITSADPRLGALADNGGPTATHALLAGSPAIDAGDNTDAPAADQRGVARPIDGNGDGNAVVDIGAFEFEPGAATDTPTPTATLPPAETPTPSPTTTPAPPATSTHTPATNTAGATSTAAPTTTPTASQTPVPTAQGPAPDQDGCDCRIATKPSRRSAWLALLPAIVLLAARRFDRRNRKPGDDVRLTWAACIAVSAASITPNKPSRPPSDRGRHDYGRVGPAQPTDAVALSPDARGCKGAYCPVFDIEMGAVRPDGHRPSPSFSALKT